MRFYLGLWILSRDPVVQGEEHSQGEASSSRPKLVVAAGGRSAVNHAGTRLLVDLADATGLSVAMSEALARLRQRDRGHDPGRVVVDVAITLADGGEGIADLAVLRNQADLFGPTASDATAWRGLDAIEDSALAVSARPEPRPGSWPGRWPPRPVA